MRPLALLSALVLIGASGCAGCTGSLAPDDDAGVPGGPRVDGGNGAGADAGMRDGGTPKPLDAGTPYFRQGFADEPCPDASYDFTPPDGGFPPGTVQKSLCIALRTFDGTGKLDGKPATGAVHFTFDAIDFRSEVDAPVDAAGHFSVRVMPAKYARLLYHPNELVHHSGSKDLGALDLRQDQSRDVDVRTWVVAGAAFFAGQPWPSTTTPLDTTITTSGLPNQNTSVSNQGGGYQVRLMDGTFDYSVSVPYESLGETRLMRYPIAPYFALHSDRTIDIDLPTSELSGNLLVDGAPLPDRLPGADHHLSYTLSDGVSPVVETVHEGGTSFFSALVPRSTYDVDLEFNVPQDPSFPSQLYNKRLISGLDLTRNQTVNVDLRTWKIEGSIMVDGEPVPANPGAIWTLYAYARQLPNQPWFLAYYQVPLTKSAFTLRAFPGEYYLSLYLGPQFAPDLATGWYDLDMQKDVYADVSLPIEIQTNLFEGTLSLDGAPASSAFADVGTLWFQSQQGTFSVKLRTTDGTFRVRLPQYTFNVAFEPNPEVYPDYAVGRYPLLSGVDMTKRQSAQLDVQTVPVAGPLWVGGAPLPDSLASQPEAGITFTQNNGFGASYHQSQQGGRPWFFVRLPPSTYKLSFELEQDALHGAAWGAAAVGNDWLLAPAP